MDIRLHSIQKGAGPPLVLLHGNGENAAYFTRQIEYFKDNYRVIAPDTRGHGKSPRGDRPFTLAQFADDLKAFLDEQGIADIFLLGFSDGANIALLFALKYPDLIKKLVVNAGNLHPRGLKLSVLLPLRANYGLACFLSPASKKAAAKKELLALMTRQPDIKEDELQKIKAPALVIAGDRDMIRRSHTEAIARHLGNARLRILAGDHFLAYKNSAAFNAEVERFLAEK